jgi:hypothetical protein
MPEQSTRVISIRPVRLEHHPRVVDQRSIGISGARREGFATLGRVEPDVSDRFLAPIDPDHDRVAVDDVQDFSRL